MSAQLELDFNAPPAAASRRPFLPLRLFGPNNRAPWLMGGPSFRRYCRHAPHGVGPAHIWLRWAVRESIEFRPERTA